MSILGRNERDTLVQKSIFCPNIPVDKKLDFYVKSFKYLNFRA